MKIKVENESLGVYTLIDIHNVWCTLLRFIRVLALEEENAKHRSNLAPLLTAPAPIPACQAPFSQGLTTRNPSKVVLGPQPEPVSPAPRIRRGDLWSHLLRLTRFLVLYR